MNSIYKIEKRIDRELLDFEKGTLPKLRNLDLTTDIVSMTSVLGVVDCDIDSAWTAINIYFIEKCNELGIPDARKMTFFRDYEEWREIHILIMELDEYLTDVLNNGAGHNYEEYQRKLYDIEHPKSYSGTRYGVITNSLGTLVAAEITRAFVDSISDAMDGLSASGDYRAKQQKLINIINQTWSNALNNKIKPLILETNKIMKVKVMENICIKLGCTYEEYEQWKRNNINKKTNITKDYTGAIEEVKKIINKNKEELSSLGKWPFGEKAKRRKYLIAENELLEKEITSLQNPKEIKELFVTYTDTCYARSYSSARKYSDNDVHLEFNSVDNVYKIVVHTNSGEEILGCCNRNFTAQYGRSRKISGEIERCDIKEVANNPGYYTLFYVFCLNEE